MPAQLLDLPPELLVHTLSFCSVPGLCALESCSKIVRSLANEEDIWAAALRRRDVFLRGSVCGKAAFRAWLSLTNRRHALMPIAQLTYDHANTEEGDIVDGEWQSNQEWEQMNKAHHRVFKHSVTPPALSKGACDPWSVLYVCELHMLSIVESEEEPGVYYYDLDDNQSYRCNCAHTLMAAWVLGADATPRLSPEGGVESAELEVHLSPLELSHAGSFELADERLAVRTWAIACDGARPAMASLLQCGHFDGDWGCSIYGEYDANKEDPTQRPGQPRACDPGLVSMKEFGWPQARPMRFPCEGPSTDLPSSYDLFVFARGDAYCCVEALTLAEEPFAENTPLYLETQLCNSLGCKRVSEVAAEVRDDWLRDRGNAQLALQARVKKIYVNFGWSVENLNATDDGLVTANEELRLDCDDWYEGWNDMTSAEFSSHLFNYDYAGALPIYKHGIPTYDPRHPPPPRMYCGIPWVPLREPIPAARARGRRSLARLPSDSRESRDR